MFALEHVLDHAVSHRKIVVGHVHSARAVAIAEAGDVVFEGDVLAGSLADRGNVDLGAADVKFPAANLAHHSKIGVVNLKFVGAYGSALGSDGNDGTAEGGGNGQSTSAGGVANHVVSGASSHAGRQGASSRAACLVDNAEFDGIANFEVEVGTNVENCANDSYVRWSKGGGGAGGFVVEGAGRAGQDSGGHWAYQKVYWGRALPGLIQVSAF